MRYEHLKEILNKIDNIDEILKLFRVNVENNIFRLKQEEEMDKRDYGIPFEELPEEDRDELYNKWNYVSADCIFNVYNAMGWSTKDFEKKPIAYSVDANCSYVEYYLSDVWYKIKPLDDWNFFYGMLILVKVITYENQVYRYIKYPIEKFLTEHDLGNLIKDESRDVFVEMSFDEKMSNASKVIENVLKKCGYNAENMKNKEYNDLIVPEIFLQIKKSKFVVVDLTQQKSGVYYEAGYAKALDKEIIFSCRSDDFENIHFDVAQQNVIKWEDEEDLKEKLDKRIEATVGKIYL
ncbi:hypothetical protein [Clostridium butyricum]|uniref:hypothetical protein n=1 Tax=Clostridium butyricum TaxID=1492 RepID=UPI00374EF905